MSRSSASKHSRKSLLQKNLLRPQVETLENRVTPSGNTISGYVYHDANNNGLFDPGEAPIANSQIQLFNSNHVLVGTTTSNAQGYYQFDTDQSTPNIDKTLTKTVTFPDTQTNFSATLPLDQFDPSLGQLVSVEIQHAGQITSQIKVENLSTQSSSHITGQVGGTLTLVAPGVNDALTITGSAGSFDAATYDGSTDFGGTSGTSFGQKTANGSHTTMVTGSDINAYIGTGKVNVSESGVASSTATGGGNLEANIASTGGSTVTVIYHYKAYGPLQPGSYTLVQPTEPPGYLDGLDANNGSVIPNSNHTDTIVVGLVNTDMPNNDFGELKSTSISGHVYYDAGNVGHLVSGDQMIAGVTMTLDGPGVHLTTTTDANGAYSFNNLIPGSYTVSETQPAGYLNGTDTPGTNGGTVLRDATHEQINTIALNSGDSAQNYDFGELKTASLAGRVYVDGHNTGAYVAGDAAIPGTTITLSGFDDQGPVSKTMTTASDGTYSFTNLRPGTYAITETQPNGFQQGHNTVGSQGGTFGATDVIAAINLNAGVDGVNNNFGEITTPDKTPDNPLPKDVQLLGQLPIISKSQLLSDSSSNYLDPAVRGQLAFVVGVLGTASGQAPSTQASLQGFESLQNGMSNAAFVNQVWSSNAQRVNQVDGLYESILNRAPTAQEQATAVAQLSNGTNVLTVMQNLYVSPEFQQLHPTSEQLATALAQSILNVTPGSTTTQNLLQSMDSEPLSTVVNGLLSSNASVANLIDNTYHQTLRRAASASEIQTWTPQIQAGTITLDGLAQRLLSSQEFYQLAYNNIH